MLWKLLQPKISNHTSIEQHATNPGDDGLVHPFCYSILLWSICVMCGRTYARRARDVRRGTERAARTQEGKASG
jgi:hypothetical protein